MMATLGLRIELVGETQNKTVADLTKHLLGLNQAWESKWANPGEWLLRIAGPGDAEWLNDCWEQIRESARHAHSVIDPQHGNNEPLRIDQFHWKVSP
jgi:hypothetical protein